MEGVLEPYVSPILEGLGGEGKQLRAAKHTFRERLWMDNGWHKDLRSKDGELCVWKAGHEDELLLAHQLIKACARKQDLRNGSRLHAEMLDRGLLRHISLGNALLSMYVKCGALSKAQEIFHELPARNIVTWNALITGYVQHGLGEQALSCFECMQDEGFSPNAVTYISVLKACGSTQAIEKGEEIHAEVGRQGLLGKDVMLGTALMDMYGKCGVLAKAQEMFDELPARDVASWTALISAYTQHGMGDQALSCFERMQVEGVFPNPVTFLCILKACGSIGATDKGQEIHAEISRQGLLEKDIALGNTLVDMYAKCGTLTKAREVLDKLTTRNATSWNALIRGYADAELNDEVLSCYEQMQDEDILPDAITFNCILEACGGSGAVEKGEEIHAEVGRQGLLEKDIVLGTALVDMYLKCGMLAKAQGVFDELPTRSVALWTALIAGYGQHGLGDEAVTCFERMLEEGLSPNAVTFMCILKACGTIGAVEKGAEIHAEIDRQGLLEKDILLGTALVDMYAKCGLLSKAQDVFDKLPEKDVALWTVLIAGYAQQGLSDEALRSLEQMQGQGFSPNLGTFVCVLKACGNIGAVDKGEKIHVEVSKQALIGKNIELGAALVDMYAKCGVLEKAEETFNELPTRHITSWNGLMSGYAQSGKVQSVFDSFMRMTGEGIEPNTVTFVVLLTACSHAGLVKEGQMYFLIMSITYCIIAALEHCTCMVDLFSRAGQFDKALSVIERASFSDCNLLWPVLMGACQNWVNVELGRWAFEHAVQADENFDAGYVCVSNLYVATSTQEVAGG